MMHEPTPSSSPDPRPATAADLPPIIRLVNQVFRPQPLFEPTMQFEHPLLLSERNVGQLLVIEQEGQVVSHVGVLQQVMRIGEVLLPVACVGSVATHPDHRGAGHAGKLMDLAIQRAREAGCVLMPISGTLSLYTRRGAAPVLPAKRATLLPGHLLAGGQSPATGRSARIRAVIPADAEALVPLLERETRGYQVDRRTLPLLLEAHLQHGCSAWVLEEQGTITALLVVRHGQPFVRHRPDLGLLVTYAGPCQHLPRMAAIAMAEHDLPALGVDLMPADHELVHTLEALGLGIEEMVPHWTILILDLHSLLKRFEHRWSARREIMLRAEGSAPAQISALVAGTVEDHLRLDRPEQVTALLFGGASHWPQKLGCLAPETRAALQEVLPLEVPDYGLCYV